MGGGWVILQHKAWAVELWTRSRAGALSGHKYWGVYGPIGVDSDWRRWKLHVCDDKQTVNKLCRCWKSTLLSFQLELMSKFFREVTDRMVNKPVRYQHNGVCHTEQWKCILLFKHNFQWRKDYISRFQLELGQNSRDSSDWMTCKRRSVGTGGDAWTRWCESALRWGNNVVWWLLFVTMKMKQVAVAFRMWMEIIKKCWRWKDRVGDAELKERNHLSKRSN